MNSLTTGLKKHEVAQASCLHVSTRNTGSLTSLEPDHEGVKAGR